ncbi:MAG: tryptophan synthase subunit alpha [Clostridia bacterium]|nr:tryptophan synthase subunit alpha [Clostridia bacterium]
MGRINDKFNELKKINKKALITFITAGDPDLNTTIEIVKEMEAKGADIIELGIPYSDPIAEGPVIQEANARALKNNIKIKDVMEAVREIRKAVSVPLIYLLYFNCILKYGAKRFFEDCIQCGVDGLIIPDLPYEEKGELEDIAAEYALDIIPLVAPTSGDRIENIARNASGFLYCVSSLGVTGVRNDFGTDFEEFFSRINRSCGIPKAIGFGISTPEHIRALKGYCDGLIVGSAIVKLVGSSSCPAEAVKNVGEFVNSLRQAMDRE